MSMLSRILSICVPLFALLPWHAAVAQTTKPADPAWSDMDRRLVFFTIQLASVENSIEATEKQLKAAGYKVIVRQNDAARFQKGNELMDRQAGGPTRWQDFYGRTAESFFYNPAPRPGELRLTATVLKTNDPNARQPRPADQRPPQFDYIYRANDNARAQAEADIAKLAGKVDQLLARRRQLESEQSGLWCKIAFRAIAGRELLARPLYRFDLKTDDKDPAAAQRLEAMRAAMDFLRVNNKLIEVAEKGVDENLPGFVTVFEETVAKSRTDFDARVMKQPLLVMDAMDAKTTLGKLYAVARRMNDVARNVSDAHKLSLDGDKAGDEQRKQTFRAQLQEALLTYAESVAAGDECVNALAGEWKIVPDLEKGVENVAAPEIPKAAVPQQPAPVAVIDPQPEKEATATSGRASAGSPKGEAAEGVAANILEKVDIRKQTVSGGWSKDQGSVTCQPDNPARLSLGIGPKTDEYDVVMEFTRHSGNQGFGVNLVSGKRTFMFQLGAVDNQFAAVNDFKDGKYSHTFRHGIANGKRQTLTVRVRKNGVEGDLDGKTIVSYPTDFSNHVFREWGFRERTLGLTSWLNVVTFHRVELIEVTPAKANTRSESGAGTDSAPSSRSRPGASTGFPREALRSAVAVFTFEKGDLYERNGQTFVRSLTDRDVYAGVIGATWASDAAGGSFSFDGKPGVTPDTSPDHEHDFLLIEGLKSKFPTENLTISLWCYPMNGGSLIGSGQTELWSREWMLTPKKFTWASVRGVSSGSKGRVVTSLPYATTPQAWNHVCLVRRRNSVEIFVNGKLAASSEAFPEQPLPLYATGLMIGNTKTDSGRWTRWINYEGGIDDVAIWNQALSKADVTRLFEAGQQRALVTEKPSPADQRHPLPPSAATPQPSGNGGDGRSPSPAQPAQTPPTTLPAGGNIFDFGPEGKK